MHQENPLLICVADRGASAMDVYSTWNLICAVQGGWKGQSPANCIRLCPAEIPTQWPGVRDNPDGSQDVLLGKPIIRVTHDQVFDENSTEATAEVLEGWVAIDGENIVNRHAGMNWVVGPLAYQTSERLAGAHGGIFYWHPQNLHKCITNLGRSATALWNVLKTLEGQTAMQETWKTGMPCLKELLIWMRQLDPNLGAFVRSLDN